MNYSHVYVQYFDLQSILAPHPNDLFAHQTKPNQTKPMDEMSPPISWIIVLDWQLVRAILVMLKSFLS